MRRLARGGQTGARTLIPKHVSPAVCVEVGLFLPHALCTPQPQPFLPAGLHLRELAAGLALAKLHTLQGGWQAANQPVGLGHMWDYSHFCTLSQQDASCCNFISRTPSAFWAQQTKVAAFQSLALTHTNRTLHSPARGWQGRRWC